MPKCRACLIEKMGGPPQGSQQLVKYRRGANSGIIVRHPNLGLQQIPQNKLHNHLPNLFHHARDTGNRVVDPVQLFAQQFEGFLDQELCVDALQWVLTRVEIYTKNPYLQGSAFLVPPGQGSENHFQQFYYVIRSARNNGDLVLMKNIVDLALLLFEGVSKVLRGDIGLDFSRRLMFEFVDTAAHFIPYISIFDPVDVYQLIQYVCAASDGDRGVIHSLGNLLDPLVYQEVKAVAIQQASTMLNYDADTIAQYL